MNKNAVYILVMYLLSWGVAFAKTETQKGMFLGFGLFLMFVMMLTSKCNCKEEDEEEEFDVDGGLPRKE